MTSVETQQSSTHVSTLKESVLIVDKENKGSRQNDVVVGYLKNELKQLLSNAGLSGVGLNKLCDRVPPLEPQRVKAVILYAEANNLNPGYVYRHLENDSNSIDPLFLQVAALDDATLALFRPAVSELKIKGTLLPDIQTPIPEDLVNLFAQFAQAFTGVEPSVVRAALYHNSAVEPDEEILQPFDYSPARPPISFAKPHSPKSDLDMLWDQVLDQLQLQMTRETFASWLQDTRLIARDGLRFTIAVKNAFAKDWLGNRLFTTIQRTLTNWATDKDGQTLAAVEIEFVVGGSM